MIVLNKMVVLLFFFFFWKTILYVTLFRVIAELSGDKCSVAMPPYLFLSQTRKPY